MAAVPPPMLRSLERSARPTRRRPPWTSGSDLAAADYVIVGESRTLTLELIEKAIDLIIM